MNGAVQFLYSPVLVIDLFLSTRVSIYILIITSLLYFLLTFAPVNHQKQRTLKLPNIVVRILAGAVFVSLLVGGMLINEYTFLVVFSAITGLSLYEFYGLMNKSDRGPVARLSNSMGGVILFLATYLFFAYSTLAGFTVYALYLLITFVSELYLKKSDPIKSLSYTALGQIYIALPFSLTNYLVFPYEAELGEYSYVFLLAVFVFIWVNDSFAYLSGMLLGKHRLFERISPKKSWEGFVGGLVFAMIASVIFSHFTTYLTLPGWIGFAAVVVAFGTWGDLIESLMKRTLGVKDSGNMIPGHGGILDRFDSTILAIPAVFIYLELLSFFTAVL